MHSLIGDRSATAATCGGNFGGNIAIDINAISINTRRYKPSAHHIKFLASRHGNRYTGLFVIAPMPIPAKHGNFHSSTEVLHLGFEL
jgi:hypothetical protein